MGLFHKNTGSKLFTSSFAISAADSDAAHNDDVVAVGTVETNDNFSDSCKAVGIADVIRLIRCLPNNGTETELFAVLKTLEIFNVDVDYLLSESARKEEVTTTRIKALNSDIKVLEDQIEQRQKEVAILDVGLNELNKVNECLYLMAKLGEDFEQETADAVLEESTADNDAMSTTDNVALTEESDSATDSNENHAKAAEVADGDSDNNVQVIDLDAPIDTVDDGDSNPTSKLKRSKKKQDDELEEGAVA